MSSALPTHQAYAPQPCLRLVVDLADFCLAPFRTLSRINYSLYNRLQIIEAQYSMMKPVNSSHCSCTEGSPTSCQAVLQSFRVNRAACCDTLLPLSRLSFTLPPLGTLVVRGNEDKSRKQKRLDLSSFHMCCQRPLKHSTLQWKRKHKPFFDQRFQIQCIGRR